MTARTGPLRRLALTGLALLVAACGRTEVPGAAAATRAPAPSSAFKWIAVRRTNEASVEEVPARVLSTAGSNAVTVPPLPARILTLLAKPGDTIAKDGAIARVIMPEVDAAVATVRATETSLAVLSKRRSQLGSLEGEGLVRASDLTALDLDIARLFGEKVRAESILKGAGLTSGGIITLRSAVAGVVTEVAATQGELRRPEDGPIARIRSHGGQRIEATFSTLPMRDGQYTFRAANEPPVGVKLVNVVPKAAGVGYVAWFEPHERVAIPLVSEGRIAIHPIADPSARVVPSSAVGLLGTSRFVVIRAGAATTSTSTVVAVEIVRIVSSDAVVRGDLPEGALVASDPYRAQVGAGGGARP